MRLRFTLGRKTGPSTETGYEQLKWSRSLCPYCGVGCGVLVGLKGNAVKKIKGDPNHPANYGLICAKGGTLADMMHVPGRAFKPLARSNTSDHFNPISWDEAYTRIATKIKSTVQAHGSDAFSFYISGQLLTEDYYVINKLAKGFLGTNNVDSNSRLCMASAVAGYTTSLGADAPPGSYEDIEHADCILIIGANMAECHPVAFQRIKQHKQANKNVKIIVVDPRETLTCDIADLHLAIRPGADIALLNGIMHYLIRNEKVNDKFIESHTNGWDELKAEVLLDSPEIYAGQSEVSTEDIEKAAGWIGDSQGFLSFWTMGLNQSIHGTAKNNAVINLHLATGKISKPGSGPFSLTGQPNAMGGRETGGLSTLLPAHRKIVNPEDRRQMELLWKVPPGSISDKNGYHAVELFDAMDQEKIKVLWVIATNPMVSMPNLNKIRRAFSKAELIIVQDAYHPTETTEAAHMVLPAAQWIEREGTVTNSERRVSLVRKLVDAPGEALPDWQIICEVARRLGYEDSFSYQTSEDIFNEYKETTKGTRLDMNGITYELLRVSPVQWPYPDATSPVSKRLYEDFKFPHVDGKAKFLSHRYRDAQDIISAYFPLILLTGRVRDQWHTMTRTGKIDKLLHSQSEPFLDMHPQDMKDVQIKNGDIARVISARGKFEAKVRRKESMKQGTVFCAMHWGTLFGTAAVNRSAADAVDPVSKQPELKFAAVRIEKSKNKVPALL